MSTRITNRHGHSYTVRSAGGGHVVIIGGQAEMYPPGEELITAIQTELGLPVGPPEVFLHLPDVGKPDGDGDYEMPLGYVSDAEEALKVARFAYAVYLKLTSAGAVKAARLAEILKGGGLADHLVNSVVERLIAAGVEVPE